MEVSPPLLSRLLWLHFVPLFHWIYSWDLFQIPLFLFSALSSIWILSLLCSSSSCFCNSSFLLVYCWREAWETIVHHVTVVSCVVQLSVSPQTAVCLFLFCSLVILVLIVSKQYFSLLIHSTSWSVTESEKFCLCIRRWRHLHSLENQNLPKHSERISDKYESIIQSKGSSNSQTGIVQEGKSQLQIAERKETAEKISKRKYSSRKGSEESERCERQ